MSPREEENGGGRPRPVVVAVAAVALSPFVVAPWLTPSLDTPRFVSLLLAAAGIAFVALLVGGKPRWSLLAASAAAVVALVLSSALSSSPAAAFTFGAENSMMGAPSWLALLVVALAASTLSLSRHVHRAVSVAAIASAVLGLAAVVERVNGRQVTVLFGNADYVAVVLVVMAPLLALDAAAARTKTQRAGWGAALAACCAGVLASGSLAGIVALIASAVFAAPLLFARRPPTLSSLKRALWILGVLVALGSLVLLGVSRTVPELAQLGGPSAAARVEMWRAAKDVIRSRPLLGVGPDGFSVASQAGISLRLLELEGGRASGVNVLIRDPHSLPLLVAASFGILGIIAGAALAVVWGDLAWRACTADPSRSRVRIAYIAAVLGFVACLTLIPWSVRFAALPALLAGLAIAPSRGRRPERRRGVAIAAASLIGVMAAGLSVAALAGDVFLERAQQARDLPSMLAALDAAASWQPTRPRLAFERLYARGTAATLGQAPADEYRKLVEASGGDLAGNAAYLVALAQPLLDQDALAGRAPSPWEREAVLKASLLAPSLPDVILERARFALLVGDLGAARGELDTAARVGLTAPRRWVYEHQYAVRTGEKARADDAAARVRQELPWMAILLDMK